MSFRWPKLLVAESRIKKNFALLVKTINPVYPVYSKINTDPVRRTLINISNFF